MGDGRSRVIDYVVARPEVDLHRVILAGWSFSGFLAPRAAAFEKRIAALVADPGQWDQSEGLKTFGLPAAALADLQRADPNLFKLMEQMLRSSQADPMLHWRIIQRLFWVHGVDSLYALAKEIARFEIWSRTISCPTLLTTAEGDPISRGAHALRCAGLSEDTFRIQYRRGKWGHCEALARSLYHQRVSTG